MTKCNHEIDPVTKHYKGELSERSPEKRGWFACCKNCHVFLKIIYPDTDYQILREFELPKDKPNLKKCAECGTVNFLKPAWLEGDKTEYRLCSQCFKELVVE